jgi:hypothetical protein
MVKYNSMITRCLYSKVSVVNHFFGQIYPPTEPCIITNATGKLQPIVSVVRSPNHVLSPIPPVSYNLFFLLFVLMTPSPGSRKSPSFSCFASIYKNQGNQRLHDRERSRSTCYVRTLHIGHACSGSFSGEDESLLWILFRRGRHDQRGRLLHRR